MKTPIDVVKGRVVDYDERRREVLIRAPYDDWYTMTKRGYKECLVQMVDSRPLSDTQRKICYSLLREISDHTGQGLDPTKEYMKLKFMVEDLEQTQDKLFSLSNAPHEPCVCFSAVLNSLYLRLGYPMPVLAFEVCGRRERLLVPLPNHQEVLRLWKAHRAASH